MNQHRKRKKHERESFLKFHFPIAIISDSFKLEKKANSSLDIFTKLLGTEYDETLHVEYFEDFTFTLEQQSRLASVVVALNTNDQIFEKIAHSLATLVQNIRHLNSDLPIFLVCEKNLANQLPQKLLTEVKFVIEPNLEKQKHIEVIKELTQISAAYVQSLTPPFFKALLNYVEKGPASWHCPGHAGGMAYLKSPIGQIFHQFFGENLLRSDVCNAVTELGQLLDHTGPVAESEKNAARIFNADHLFFVTNGTSTSNKIVWHSLVGPNDIVVVDRNCHKSNLHAIIMTGAIPIFLNPTRNHFGIIGPIPLSEFSPESIQKKIDENPFILDKKQKPRLMTLTQSTYDGIIYNVEIIKKKLDGLIDALHFDEAWLPHAAFSELYKNMHAIGTDRPKTQTSMIFSTQSTHKFLAGLSQSSQILVSDSKTQKLNTTIFNEAYLMHTSTSPLYSLIASADVAAQMMDGPGGKALVHESISEALSFRQTMKTISIAYTDDWWFEVWGPDSSNINQLTSQQDWLLKPNQEWHGFKQLQPDFNMLDPIKVTILTPGLNIDGSFDLNGIPANIVTTYLCEHGVIIEKCGLYSFFMMFTIGITKERLTHFINTLEKFKHDYDTNQLLEKTLPLFVSKNPQYKKIGLKDLCTEIHQSYKQNDVARMTTNMYVSNLIPVMKPSEAFNLMTHGQIVRLGLDELEGQITAVLLTPYPPGIPLMIPGERFNKTIIDYLMYVRDFNQKFPGFETDVHGLVCETVNGQKKYFVDCLKNPV